VRTPRMRHATRRSTLMLAALALVATIGCDRASKSLARSVLRGGPALTWLGGSVRAQFVENQGAFLGLGSGLDKGARFWLFGVGAGALLLGCLAVAARQARHADEAVAAALLVGGGSSNLVDRLWYDGAVTDFLVLGLGPARTGVFNLADVAILAGAGLWLASIVRRAPAPPPASAPPPARR
jgi:signal peptidase II